MMDKKKQINWKVVCTGIACLTGLEVYALSQGIDGIMLVTVVAIISGAIGYTIPSPIKN